METDRYIAMAAAWRETLPADVMTTEAILEETLRVLRQERASALQSERNGMAVRPNRVYGTTFQKRRKPWKTGHPSSGA